LGLRSRANCGEFLLLSDFLLVSAKENENLLLGVASRDYM